ncbi:hypothetical protein TEU_09230 [Thermococcus eurythermalis]|uniref:Uncharacterized protein n=2 Tax=Thermococcus eurythermalis TaxID=1505907 RepID=A0A097QVJ4_9EURY|nr:hypothetical protein TEU_09230 [Thermococcus eurythermalis]
MESYYDNVPEFRYWDVSAWRKYIEKYIGRIYTITEALLQFREHLKTWEGERLSEVPEEYRKFFIGGVTEEGPSENALSWLVWSVYGAGITEFDKLRDMLKANEHEGALQICQVRFIDEDSVEFLKFLKKANHLSKDILSKALITVPTSFSPYDLVRNPREFVKAIGELYLASANFSAAHNYYTFFIISTRNIHYKYLLTAYPRLETNFGVVREFLKLEPMFEPSIEIESLRRKYTIWTHSKGGLADKIYSLNELVMETFNFPENRKHRIKRILKYAIQEPEDLKLTYYQLAKDALEKVVADVEAKLYHQFNTNKLTITINDLSVTVGNKYGFQRTMSLPLFLNTIGPWLFLGLGKLERGSEPNTLVYKPVEV